MKRGAIKIFVSIFLILLGASLGVGLMSFIDLPYTEVLEGQSDVYYSLNGKEGVKTIGSVSPNANEVSVHFLELGNKYTGDCTYIKVGENIDILIDCGSRTSSIDYVKQYLDKYVTDGILEYVIVTHAHADHYAGFATSTKWESIFDIYYCQNIIYFSRVVDGKSGSMYNNFLRELNDTKSNVHKEVYNNPNTRAKSNVFTALDCIMERNGASKIFNLLDDGVNSVQLEILNSYYYTNTSKTENDHSVCCMISHNDKNFLFTGDLEETGEEYLVNLNEGIFNTRKADLYKAGHHGSKTSSTDILLASALKSDAIVCVCCCAGSSEYTQNPENQFPTKEFINRISQYTIYVYVTTMCINYKESQFTSFNGNIAIISTNDPLAVYCSNNTTLLKDSDWFKTNRLEMCGAGLNERWK